MDKLTAMKVFREVATKGSFTLAADELVMSRAKVTRYINELENWLNCRLFNRSTRKVSLTLAGEGHRKEAKKILDLTTNFKNLSSHTTQTPCGKIRVSTSVAFGEAHLAKAVVEFLKCYPDVQIELVIDDQCFDLIENRIDLAIRTFESKEQSLITRPISNAKAILCAAPKYLENYDKIEHPNDILKHKVILCTNFKPVGKWTLKNGDKEVNLDLKAGLISNDILVLSRATVAGGGIARLPCFLARPLIYKGELEQVLPEWSAFDLKIWAVYTCREHQPAAVRRFIDFLVQYFEDLKVKLLGTANIE